MPPHRRMLREALRAADVPPFHAMAMARRAAEAEARGQPRAAPRGRTARHRRTRRGARRGRRGDGAAPTRSATPTPRGRWLCGDASAVTTPSAYGVEVAADDVLDRGAERRRGSRSRSWPRSMPAIASACSNPATPATATRCSPSASSRSPIPVGPDTRWAPTAGAARCGRASSTVWSSPHRRTRPAPCSSRRAPGDGRPRGARRTACS